MNTKNMNVIEFFTYCINKMPNTGESWDFVLRRFAEYYGDCNDAYVQELIVWMISILEYKLTKGVNYETYRRSKEDTHQEVQSV